MRECAIELKFYLSPFARRTLALVSEFGDLSLFVDLLADAVINTNYNSFSSRRPEKARRKNVTLKTNISVLRAIGRLRRKGYSLSWIMEESIYLAFKNGYIKAR